MGRLVLGVDIADDRLTAVQIEQKGKVPVVTDQASVPLPAHHDLDDGIEKLFRHFPDYEGVVVCGMPLQQFSVRNLFLPFRDGKRIAQTLPMEMSDQLIAGAERHLIDYLVARRNEEGSDLLVFGILKERLAALVAAFSRVRVDPEVVVPSVVAFCRQYQRYALGKEGALLLHLDTHCTTLGVVQGGSVIFSRRLPHPEQMFTHPPLASVDGRLAVVDEKALEGSIHLICKRVERALDLFRVHEEVSLDLSRAVLYGPLSEMPSVLEGFDRGLALSIEGSNLMLESGCGMEGRLEQAYTPARHDAALALALEGLQRRPWMNFRRDEFARKRTFGTVSTRLGAVAGGLALLLAGSIGYLLVDGNALQSEYDELQANMEDIYRSAFPADTRVIDPLAQMQSRMQELRVPAVSLPAFAQDRRVLGLLTDISARIPESISIQVARLVVDQEGVSLKGTTDAFNNVDTIKSRLEESGKYPVVQIVSANAEKENNLVRFEMKLQTGEVL